MSLHRLLLAAIALLLGVGAFSGVQSSSASFTASSAAPMDVTAADDWTPPTVALTDPGTPLTGTVSVSVSASDARSAVASVAIQSAPDGSSTWTTICTDAVAPYSCAWVTTGVTDGTYRLRAQATDTAGYSATSATVTTQVINDASVALDPIDNVLRGSVALRAVAGGTGTAAVTMRFEYAVADASPQVWSAIPGCGNATGTTRTCTWATTGAETYDVRAVAQVGSGSYYDTQTDVLVDNVAPAVTLTVPTGTLRGAVVLTATSTDADSGVDTVSFQYKLASAGTWSVCGVAADAPYSCTVNTAALANGSYTFRAVSTDVAGNSTTSLVETRAVDNTVATVSVTSPGNGSTVAGNVTVTAAANAPQGVASVRIEGRVGTSGPFAALCTDTTAPYTCTYDSTTVANGTYQVQAVLTPTSGAAVTSAVVTITVDNTPLRAQDVQTINGGATDRPDAGDRVVLTYSTPVNLSTIKPGWNGTSTSVTVTFKDKNVSGAGAGSDRMDLTGANLGQVSFSRSFVAGNRSVVMNNSSMIATTTTVGGVPVTVVTITLGTPSSSGDLSRVTNANTLRWTPSTAVTNLAGMWCSSAVATESGANDRDF